ncbi:hypothetical protein D9758_008143 [Tetrapyrgos nigripes]|uniref:Uncharacterized protein n=1 Tax=Tetrapyrgos nigripes TaxID=182062 RepID=A0A8H5GHJ1_9AGAR|nr:hypothetical protein D9758_008143 [Tetrapyrgos nigripes]
MSDSEPKSPLPVHSSKIPRGNSQSTRKYCLWITGLTGLAACGCILPSVVTTAHKAYQWAAHPHEYLYQNQTLSEVANRSLVVQPLINKEQTFDVAVSVWVRRTIDEEFQWRESQHDPADFQLYRPLFSDVVFHGLRLSDKGKYTNINFTMPTEKFREGTLAASDLIGTFVLIPTSPSLMDFVVDYSSYIPDFALSSWQKTSPVRTWPFPMGSEYKGEKTLVDMALESFSLRMPLIRFHKIPSRCQKDGAVDVISNDPVDHPHVITWSQLQVVDETHILNLEAYNKAHEEYKKTSCGRKGKYSFESVSKSVQRYCQWGESYWETGVLQTRLELKMKDPEHTEWAYTPYMIYFLHASGPQDLIPIPVHEDCLGKPALEASQNTSTFDLIDSDSMNITWHISFSGRTPAKLRRQGPPGPEPIVDHGQSDYHKVVEQDFIELANGIKGFRKPDAHPRRRAFLIFMSSNTVSISVPGTLFLAVHQGLQVLMAWMAVLLPSHTPSSDWTQAMFYLVYLPLIYRMFRIVLRFESVWKGWIPTFRKRGASHSERTSERLDATTSWRVRLSLLCTLFLLFYFVEDHLVLLPALHPPLPKESSLALLYWFRDLLYDIDRCFWITGLLSQLILNTKSERFAGNFKLSVFLIWLKETLQLLSFVSAVVGRVKTRPALLWPETLLWCVETVLVYQAVTLPAVGPVRLDDDEQ